MQREKWIIYTEHIIKHFPNMKAILIAFLLFASLFFLPTSTTARQLKGNYTHWLLYTSSILICTKLINIIIETHETCFL